jgi:dienelactone hydrolase
MHCHGGVRWIGAEQLVDLGRDRTRESTQLRDTYYDGLAPANELARRGYVVMVHDTFSWGSRRFELSAPTFKVETVMRAFDALWREQGISKTEAERFNVASDIHEDSLAKLAGMLNHTLAGAIVSDDLVALDVLAGLPNVDSRRLGTFGFSGGGARSLFLAALDSRITSYVVTCMMSTFASLFPNFVDAHSWLLNSPGLWNLRDWPTLSQLASARSFLVQYRAEDEYFPAKGMRDADSMLGELDNRRGRYHRAFHPGGHQFDAEMQNEAWDFFDRTLRGIAT